MACRRYLHLLRLIARELPPVGAFVFLALAAITSLAQETAGENATASASSSEAGTDLASGVGYTVTAVAIGAIITCLLILRRHLATLRDQQETADALFKAQVLGSFASDQTSSPFLATSFTEPERDTDESAPSPVSVSTHSVPPAGPAPAPNPSPSPTPLLRSYGANTAAVDDHIETVAAAALAQLRNAGLLDSIEAYVELNGNPRGAAALRLRDGRRALLVPYFETEAFARRQLRRYDLLLFLNREGRAVIVSALETLIADRLSAGMR